MGAFTFGVSAVLVAFQCTLVLLQLDQTTWSFSLVIARPDAAEWAPELSALLRGGVLPPPLLPPRANNNNITTDKNNTKTNNGTALQWVQRNTTTTNATAVGDSLLQLTMQQTSSLTCLRAAIVNASPDTRSAFAASCILRTHTPANPRTN